MRRNSLVVAVLAVSLIAAPAAAQSPSSGWFDRGLGFVRKYYREGMCRAQHAHLADAIASLAPNALGAAVGVALGAAAGVMATRSITGAVRGALVGGTLGSAAGHLAASSGAGDKVKEIAHSFGALLEERNAALCEVLHRGEQLRAPVLVHLGAAVGPECRISPDAIADMTPRAERALARCVDENETARHIADQHATTLQAINRGTCHAAAYVVDSYEQRLAEQAEREHLPWFSKRGASECDDDESTAWQSVTPQFHL
jgi:hypothetical protein